MRAGSAFTASTAGATKSCGKSWWSRTYATDPCRPATPRPPAPPTRRETRNDLPARIWAETEADTHRRRPSRPPLACQPQSLAARGGTPPTQLRWLPASRTRPGPHTGAGSLVALLAKPAEWADAWPRTYRNRRRWRSSPWISNGNPALDRPPRDGGLGKRTLGDKTGRVLTLGNPLLGSTDAPVRVAEGVADALALAARFTGPMVASMGDAGMNATGFAHVAGQRRGGRDHPCRQRPGRTEGCQPPVRRDPHPRREQPAPCYRPKARTPVWSPA